MADRTKKRNRAGSAGAGARPNEAPPSNPVGGEDLARALGAELGDLGQVAGVIAAAVATRFENRVLKLRAGLEMSTNPAGTGDRVADAVVQELLDELEALRLRPERGRWKDLRRIARFVDRAEERLASGHQPVARAIRFGTENSGVEDRVP